MNKTCAICQEPLPVRKWNQRYCFDICSKKAENQRAKIHRSMVYLQKELRERLDYIFRSQE